MIPTAAGDLPSRARISREARMIGRSVIRGESATFIPPPGPCFRDSLITRVSKGPGDIPAESPRVAPSMMYVNKSPLVIFDS